MQKEKVCKKLPWQKMRYLETFYLNICTYIFILCKLAKYKIKDNPCESFNRQVIPTDSAHPAKEVTLKCTALGPVWG